MLANFVESSSNKNSILDLCSGTGVISILLSAKVKYKSVISVELQEQMYDLLKRNITINSLDDNIRTINMDLRNVKDLRQQILVETQKNTVDIITVNPPYKAKNTGIINENMVKYIARHEENCTLDDIFNVSSKLLNDSGKLYLVHKPERLADLVTIARKYNLEMKKIRFVFPRKDSKPSIVLIMYVKNGGNEVNVMPPLVEYDENGDYTEEIYNMYGWCNPKD